MTVSLPMPARLGNPTILAAGAQVSACRSIQKLLLKRRRVAALQEFGVLGLVPAFGFEGSDCRTIRRRPIVLHSTESTSRAVFSITFLQPGRRCQTSSVSRSDSSK